MDMVLDSHINPVNALSDFKEDDKVRYIPKHLIQEYFESEHPDWYGDHGIVTSVNEKYVFVRYIRNGILQHTSQATDPRDLINDTKPIFSRYETPKTSTPIY